MWINEDSEVDEDFKRLIKNMAGQPEALEIMLANLYCACNQRS